MNITLYMATSINGYIADKKGNTPWSATEWKSFKKQVILHKIIIIGRKTYDIMKKGDIKKIGNPIVIVITKKQHKDLKKIFFVHNPKEAITLIKEKHFTSALLCGGAIVNSAFLRENLVQNIILDIEPIIFGQGIPLCNDMVYERKLHLKKVIKLSAQLIQVQYSIKNPKDL